jgi:RNA polymerase sigma-70 factor (ECF subfamily)
MAPRRAIQQRQRFSHRLGDNVGALRVRQSEAARVRDTGYAREIPTPEVSCVVDEVVRQSEERLLRFAVAGLSPVRREAIMLTFFGGLSYSEASRHLGIPLSTMKTRIRDGLFALRGATVPVESPDILRVNSAAQ